MRNDLAGPRFEREPSLTSDEPRSTPGAEPALGSLSLAPPPLAGSGRAGMRPEAGWALSEADRLAPVHRDRSGGLVGVIAVALVALAGGGAALYPMLWPSQSPPAVVAAVEEKKAPVDTAPSPVTPAQPEAPAAAPPPPPAPVAATEPAPTQPEPPVEPAKPVAAVAPPSAASAPAPAAAPPAPTAKAPVAPTIVNAPKQAPAVAATGAAPAVKTATAPPQATGSGSAAQTQTKAPAKAVAAPAAGGAAPAAAAAAPKAAVPPKAPSGVGMGVAPHSGPHAPVRPTPAAQPRVDPNDPYQVRAMAVGLHPELPPDLLRRLSNADYANANIAIHTALMETPEGRELTYPPGQAFDEATYRVRVLHGSRPGCTRYVVIVRKDGWSHTAPPMEKCGLR